MSGEPYRSYGYLTPGEDLPEFDLAPEFGRVPPCAARDRGGEPMITRRTLDIPELDLAIPYFDVQGRADGPRLAVLARVHGAEYASIAAVREFVRGLDADAVSGRIVVVPVVNVPGFWARAPFVVPADRENLNRADPAGTYKQVLAHHVYQTFILGSDYLVDMHAGDVPEALEPFTIFEESPVEAASLDLATAFGLGHIVRQAAAARTVAGSTCAAAADAGIPAIVA
jgi:predicted deacylase